MHEEREHIPGLSVREFDKEKGDMTLIAEFFASPTLVKRGVTMRKVKKHRAMLDKQGFGEGLTVILENQGAPVGTAWLTFDLRETDKEGVVILDAYGLIDMERRVARELLLTAKDFAFKCLYLGSRR